MIGMIENNNLNDWEFEVLWFWIEIQYIWMIENKDLKYCDSGWKFIICMIEIEEFNAKGFELWLDKSMRSNQLWLLEIIDHDTRLTLYEI